MSYTFNPFTGNLDYYPNQEPNGAIITENSADLLTESGDYIITEQ